MSWFTRDSFALYIAFATVVVTYLLASEKTPPQYDFRDWLQFVSVLLAWATGKLQSSPLPHSDDKE